MHYHRTGTSRALFGLAAAAMSVATFAIMVIAPAGMDFSSHDVVVSTAVTDTASNVATTGESLTTSIDVVARRTSRLVPVVQSRAIASKHDQAPARPSASEVADSVEPATVTAAARRSDVATPVNE